jgi:hypothetical protein
MFAGNRVTKLRRSRWVRWSTAWLLVAAGVIAIADAQQPRPAFRVEAELFTLKVQVVAPRGKGLPVLSAEQFEVRVGGRKRNVMLAELIGQDEGGSSAGAVRGRLDDTDLAGLTRNEEKLFRPPVGQRSALYLLGVEVTDAERRNVKVRVGHKDVSLRGWAWCAVPAKCRPAAGTPIRR